MRVDAGALAREVGAFVDVDACIVLTFEAFVAKAFVRSVCVEACSVARAVQAFVHI